MYINKNLLCIFIIIIFFFLRRRRPRSRGLPPSSPYLEQTSCFLITPGSPSARPQRGAPQAQTLCCSRTIKSYARGVRPAIAGTMYSSGFVIVPEMGYPVLVGRAQGTRSHIAMEPGSRLPIRVAGLGPATRPSAGQQGAES